MRVTHYRLGSPVSIALLSDLHNRYCSDILSLLRESTPSIISFAGDLVNGIPTSSDDSTDPDGSVFDDQPNALALLEGLAGIAPTFVSLGNHEWVLSPADIRRIADTGCRLLDNTFTVEQGVVIGGLTSAYVDARRQSFAGREHLGGLGGLRNADSLIPETEWLAGMERTPGYRILLCHHPEYYARFLAHRGLDLILSGHAHGGQWEFFGRGVFAPGQGFFPKYTAGVYDGRLVVSRGLKNTARIPRICNPTEIVLID